MIANSIYYKEPENNKYAVSIFNWDNEEDCEYSNRSCDEHHCIDNVKPKVCPICGKELSITHVEFNDGSYYLEGNHLCNCNTGYRPIKLFFTAYAPRIDEESSLIFEHLALTNLWNDEVEKAEKIIEDFKNNNDIINTIKNQLNKKKYFHINDDYYSINNINDIKETDKNFIYKIDIEGIKLSNNSINKNYSIEINYFDLNKIKKCTDIKFNKIKNDIINSLSA